LIDVESGKWLTASLDGGNKVVTGQNAIVAEDDGTIGGQKKRSKTSKKIKL